MWTETAVTRALKLRYPIVQGPFGGGLSSAAQVAIVAERGGLGSFGANHQTPSQISSTIAELKGRTTAPFAINLWVSNEDPTLADYGSTAYERQLERLRPYFTELELPLPVMPQRFGERFEEQIEALIEATPPIFSFVYGIPPASILERCRQHGIRTIGTATSVDEAVAIEAAGVDAVVATGFEAGGHRVSFLRPPEECLTGTMALVPQVRDAVRIPVIAAGGIADGRGVAAALTLGADAVQIGTAFLACAESGTNAAHRAVLQAPEASRTTLTRAFSGRLARGVVNRLADELAPLAGDFAPYPAQAWMVGQLRARAAERGRADLMSLWCGQAAALAHNRTSAALFDELVAQTTALLSRDPGIGRT